MLKLNKFKSLTTQHYGVNYFFADDDLLNFEIKPFDDYSILNMKAIDAFQDEDVPLIFCSLQASATGITLTSSDTAVFLEYLWSPAVSQQAQDRIHRLSQTKPVTIYNLYCPKSIEMQKGMRSYAKELDMKGIL